MGQIGERKIDGRDRGGDRREGQREEKEGEGTPQGNNDNAQRRRKQIYDFCGNFETAKNRKIYAENANFEMRFKGALRAQPLFLGQVIIYLMLLILHTLLLLYISLSLSPLFSYISLLSPSPFLLSPFFLHLFPMLPISPPFHYKIPSPFPFPPRFMRSKTRGIKIAKPRHKNIQLILTTPKHSAMQFRENEIFENCRG